MDMEQIILGNPVEHWLTTFGATIVFWLALQFIKYITVKKVGKLAEKTETKLDDLAITLLDKTRFYFLIFVAFYYSSKLLVIPPRFLLFWQHSIIVAIALQVVVWGNATIEFVFGKDSKIISKEATNSASYGVLGFVSRLVMWSTVLLITLSNLGVNITAIVTGLGVGGIAVALAAQKILGDIFSSFIIVLDKPFEIGDFIVIGEFQGTVEKVGIKTTRFRSLTGEQIIMPNSVVIDSKLRNFKRMEERRVSFKINVEYGTPSDKLEQIPKLVEEILASTQQTRFVFSAFREFTDFSLIFETVYFVESSDYNLYLNVQEKINLAIYKKFADLGIRFAVPVRRMLTDN